MCQQAKLTLSDFWTACGLPGDLWPAAQSRYEHYWELIQARNDQDGLMGHVTADEFYLKHVADSLALLAAYPHVRAEATASDFRLRASGTAEPTASLAPKPEARSPKPVLLADVGCGAGLPGIILAIALPGLRLAAIESNHRKSRFLADAVFSKKVLGLSERVEVLCRRGREVGHDENYQGRFRFVTARAVASSDKLIGECRLLLSPGGEAFFYKTPAAITGEMPLALRAAGKYKLAVDTSAVIELPRGAGRRQFVRVRKSA